jgi:hypothetical protein
VEFILCDPCKRLALHKPICSFLVQKCSCSYGGSVVATIDKKWLTRRKCSMSAKPGEIAEETGTFHRADCGHTVLVEKGENIPECPCEKHEYDRCTDEPGRKSSG